MSHQPEGFEFTERDDAVYLTHHGRPATTLRGARAAEFLADLQNTDAQQLMARVTGNYRHGNERVARNHPRNRGT